MNTRRILKHVISRARMYRDMLALENEANISLNEDYDDCDSERKSFYARIERLEQQLLALGITPQE